VAEGVVAVPDPGARTGRPAQFTLRVGSKRLGIAVASVTVSVPHVRTIAPVDRDHAVTAEAVREQDGEVAGVRFEPLPRLDEVIGAHARRSLAAGEVLSQAVVAVPDAVQAGDEVKVVVRVGVLEAWGVGRASGSGRIGDVVRITRGTARGLQRALVLSPGVVQVLLEQPQEIR
jgi:flagella basal body P-ring formation protein FlgA